MRDPSDADGVDLPDTGVDRDVVIVGGGPAGCSAAVFTAGYGLDTVVFDRGNAALRRCAYLENYLGFPAGIEVETFYDLMRDHVEAAGGDVVDDMVESVERASTGADATDRDDGSAFVVETQDGRRLTAARVVAAAWYDGEYLRPLGGDAMFELHEHHGEEHERFDPDYPDADGRTLIDGLYVAAPCGDRNDQAIVAAGQGAHVARSLLEDLRSELGYPDGVAEHYDWIRTDAELSGEWADRDRWREWFENEAADEWIEGDDRLETLREAYIDRAFDTAATEDEVSDLAQRGYDRLLEHVPDDRIRAYLDRSEGGPA